MRKLLGFLCVCALAIVTARAQDAVDDYVSSAAGQSVIYHGKEQLKYPTSIRNHPYLKSEKYVPGDLSFEGILYKDVKMRLDLYKNELLLFSPDNRYNIVLPSDRVDYAFMGTISSTGIRMSGRATCRKAITYGCMKGSVPCWGNGLVYYLRR